MPALSLLASKLFSVSVIVPVSTSASVSVCVLYVTVRVILSRVLSVISQFKFFQSVWFIYCMYTSSVRVISLYSLFVNYLISRHSTIAPCSHPPSFCLRPFVLLSDHLELTTACTTTISASAPLKSSASHIVHLGPLSHLYPFMIPDKGLFTADCPHQSSNLHVRYIVYIWSG